MQRVRERGDEALITLARRLAGRVPPPKERKTPWFISALLSIILPTTALVVFIVAILWETLYVCLFFAGVFGVLILGFLLSRRHEAQQSLRTEASQQDIRRLQGYLEGKISSDTVPALLTLMERLGQQSSHEAKVLWGELQDALTAVLPFLTFIELQSLKAEHRAFLIATLRERTGLSGAVSADWTIAVLLALGTLQDTGAEATARALALRDRNERIREAATEYLQATR